MPDEREESKEQHEPETNPEQMSEEELRAELEKHFREQSVSDLVVQFLVTLSNLAYMKMGLTEETKDSRDLAQAGMAIDSFKALLDGTAKKLPAQDASALAGALSSMQLTFVKISSEDEGAGSPDAGSASDGFADKDAGSGSEGGTDEGDSGESEGDTDEGGTEESTGDKPKDDDPASRLWVPGKE